MQFELSPFFTLQPFQITGVDCITVLIQEPAIQKQQNFFNIY